MSPSTLFLINFILFVLCVIIQFRALNRIAAGRAIFITIAMFFFTLLVYLAPDAPRFLSWLLLAITWAYTLFMTAYAMGRRKKQ